MSEKIKFVGHAKTISETVTSVSLKLGDLEQIVKDYPENCGAWYTDKNGEVWVSVALIPLKEARSYKTHFAKPNDWIAQKEQKDENDELDKIDRKIQQNVKAAPGNPDLIVRTNEIAEDDELPF
jgi:hypothetical protein